MGQICFGRTANDTVIHAEDHFRLHYGNRELNGYDFQGLYHLQETLLRG